MKLNAFLGLGMFVLSLGASAETLQIRVQEVPTSPEVIEQIQNAVADVSVPKDHSYSDAVLDDVVNLGKDVWKVIEANQPVANIRNDYASAIPRGADRLEDIAGFSDLQYKSYNYTAKNLYGITVVDVTYTIVHMYGGSVHGKGQYLDSVGIVPSNVQVLWGYAVDLEVKHVATQNVGTHEDPIASIVMEMMLSVKTVLKKDETKSVFQFRGDSADVLVVQ